MTESKNGFEKYVCYEAFPKALEYGEVIECARPGNHRKHQNRDKTLSWTGPKLTEEELEEAQRIRELGGNDPEKFQKWLKEREAALESIKEGLRQSGAGETVDLGDFTQYADDEEEA